MPAIVMETVMVVIGPVRKQLLSLMIWPVGLVVHVAAEKDDATMEMELVTRATVIGNSS